jgi:hypothetical protein
MVAAPQSEGPGFDDWKQCSWAGIEKSDYDPVRGATGEYGLKLQMHRAMTPQALDDPAKVVAFPPSTNGKGKRPRSEETLREGKPGEQSAEPVPLRRSELLALAVNSAESGDEDTYAEIAAELMSRFRMTGSQIQAALIRLLTSRKAGGRTPQAGMVNISTVDHLDHLVSGFIAAREQTLFHAPKGCGKTIAALAVARAVVTGTPLLDRGTAPKPGRVLYLATDSGCASMHTQMQELGLLDLPEFQHEHPEQRFYIRGHDTGQGITAWEATIPEILWLIQTIRDQKIDLVIVDSAKACLSLTDLEYTDNKAVGALLTLFQRVVCPHAAVLWLHHDGRENGHNAGAKAWAEIPVMVHRIERAEQPKGGRDEGEGQLPKGARKWACIKSRISGDEREFHYVLTPDGGLQVTADVEIVSNCRDAVIDVLRRALLAGRDDLSRQELLEEVMRRHGRSFRSTENTVAAMARGRAPDLVRPGRGRGRYALSPRLRTEMALKSRGSIGGGE